jgi:hypothetical protein
VLRRLTVKLRGRTEAPDGAEGAQFLSARGARPQAHHGPLQRLLDVVSPRLESLFKLFDYRLINLGILNANTVFDVLAK